MRSDTKVGVLVGLVIVVAASVYFYGNGEDGDEVLVSSAERATPSPEIPVSTERKKVRNEASATPPSSAKRSASDAARKPRRVASRNRTARPFAPAGKRLSAGAKAGGRSVPGPSRGVATRKPLKTGGAERLVKNQPRRPTAGQPAKAPAGASRPTPGIDWKKASEQLDATKRELARIAARHNSDTGLARPSTPLRTSASETVKEATRANLDQKRSPEPQIDSAVTRRSPRPSPQSGGSSGAWPKRHRVRSGDTLYEIAERYYQSGAKTAMILRANPGIDDPRVLKIGSEITLPDPRTARSTPKPRPAVKPRPPAGGRTYVVRSGDSFYAIAKRVYGDSRRWRSIFDLNKTVVKNDPKRLKPGMTIQLPPK
ncbi:MAG: LysM peptidoglycan-binding domain-containing protein [Phycisphaerae bacterium]